MRLSARYLLLIITCILTHTTYAQKTEIGILLGGSYYYGDIINKTYIETQSVHQAGGLFFRKHISKKVCLRFNLMYARLAAADSNLEKNGNDFQRRRNLAFYTDIFEASGVVEYNLVKDQNEGNHFIPYVYGGLGLFYYDPKAIQPITGQTISLSPLQLEGESYSSFALAVPIGAGIRYYINKNWQIGFDLGMRFTSTSHIDDINGISHYQDPTTLKSEDAKIMSDRSAGGVAANTGVSRGKIGFITDMYYIYGITVSYRISSGIAGNGFRGAAISCPRFY